MKVGDKIRGFKFEEREYDNGVHLIHFSEMDKYIGKIGKIIVIRNTFIEVVFEDNKDNEDLPFFQYPKEEAEQHLVNYKPTQYQIGIDTFERAEANMTKEEILSCVKFSIDKYNWRKKGQDKEDFKKIIDYAKWGLKQLEDE